MTCPVLAVDCGGTEIKAGIVEPDGTLRAQHRLASREGDGLTAWAGAVLAAAHQSLTSWPGEAPTRLGLSVPGAVDPSTATLVDLVARLPEGSKTRLGDLFGALGLQVFADNDARAALQAERRWGVARAVDDAVLMTVGTGLGGAAIVGGSAPGGDRILAGNQLGHISIDRDGEPCVCGNIGCADRLASGPGLVKLAASRGLAEHDAAAVFGAYRRGVPAAVEAVDEFTVALAAAVVNAIHAYQPELVVLGGGVLRAAELFVPRLRALVAEHAWTLPRARVRVEVSALGDNLGILGAAAVAFSPQAA